MIQPKKLTRNRCAKYYESNRIDTLFDINKTVKVADNVIKEHRAKSNDDRGWIAVECGYKIKLNSQ